MVKIFRPWTAVVDLLLPNRCFFCDMRLSGGVCICGGCLKTLEIISDSTCRRCGAPAHRSVLWCVQCSGLEFRFHRNVSLGVFEGRLRTLVHLFKFEGRWSLFRPLGRLMADTCGSYITWYDLLVPIPLSPARIAERGYNQSALLTRAVSEMTGVPSFTHALERRGNAPPQSSVKSVEERMKNMTDRFTVKNRLESLFRGKRMLLIDDVMTTGATASAVADVLVHAGAAAVDVLTLARALRTSGSLYHLKNRPIMK